MKKNGMMKVNGKMTGRIRILERKVVGRTARKRKENLEKEKTNRMPTRAFSKEKASTSQKARAKEKKELTSRKTPTLKLSPILPPKIRPGKLVSHGKHQNMKRSMNQRQEKPGILRIKEKPGKLLVFQEMSRGHRPAFW